MRCPDEISGILLEIIRLGVLRIRGYGWSGLAGECATEADHIHNLPDLLENYSMEKLCYYWNVERVAYVERMADAEHSNWTPLWDELRPLVESLGMRSKTF
jgi:hypothetical protein